MEVEKPSGAWILPRMALYGNLTVVYMILMAANGFNVLMAVNLLTAIG